MRISNPYTFSMKARVQSHEGELYYVDPTLAEGHGALHVVLRYADQAGHLRSQRVEFTRLEATRVCDATLAGIARWTADDRAERFGNRTMEYRITLFPGMVNAVTTVFKDPEGAMKLAIAYCAQGKPFKFEVERA